MSGSDAAAHNPVNFKRTVLSGTNSAEIQQQTTLSLFKSHAMSGTDAAAHNLVSFKRVVMSGTDPVAHNPANV